MNSIEKCVAIAPPTTPQTLRDQACASVMGDLPQVACLIRLSIIRFPPEAYMYAVPYEYYKKYARKYGSTGRLTAMCQKNGTAARETAGGTEAGRMPPRGGSMVRRKYGKSVDTSMDLRRWTGCLWVRAQEADAGAALMITQFGLSHRSLWKFSIKIRCTGCPGYIFRFP